ncbi:MULTISPECIES: protein-glutamate methylesterase/protein-glutamine glutaminase [Brevibacillus]|uniref:Protein-glutamate methylesterase/protein-glutamine glutaminase n=1 Tax=Brevibacillus parabrevis TaxID=54914 RepID=A0A4Y3PI96_BREPA|nr:MULTISPECIES: chemotaxis response regulator protein-glutamate methylesterase [Brevibacillus]MBU8711394.1 chemotaxis response regulator protein-glutamate methylesterase [Brevibacillus parabrevis]MDH6349978.1 two-component system chemotaxis response regulator CheB [Brevibacillus sp. 1238]MDR4999430.1 chemotaxis response regulator protein-glutamate methylesterase [Brevibacillus parabrevis]MED1721703.1 chemotaxis response regulator protein-glutamate methylesterase [Brevibacillus parabrevis]MED2
MSKIRVLVTDDSAFMRKVISDILSGDPEIEVIDRAKNGLECVEKCKQLSPDVLTLDIEMPVMNGLEALEKLMVDCPVPVVMLSSLTREGAEATIQALELGAFDFITKPSGPISLDIHKVADRLIERVKAAAAVKGRMRRTLRPSRPAAPEPTRQSPIPAPAPLRPAQPVINALPRIQNNGKARLVVLGTSTGGPKALQNVLTAIPAGFPAPIAIVQHMPAGFTKSLAQRLDSLCQIRVTEVTDGEWLEPGTAYIAPGGYHFEVQQVSGKLQALLHQQEPRGGHRPSVDVLFESVSRLTNVDKWAIIMTGMGNDGTKGLKQMKEFGPVTSIIEDESSCVVFGMPRAAIQAGLADHVAPLEKIPELLCKLLH